jgi:hypothetical protein
MLGVSLPADYVTFVCRSNGGEGFIGGHYLVLERVEKLKSMNDNCETAQYAPGLLLFGSDGAGEAYAFDTRHHPWTVVQVPFIVMDLEDAWPVGQTFSEFLRIFGSPQPDRKFTRGEEI